MAASRSEAEAESTILAARLNEYAMVTVDTGKLLFTAGDGPYRLSVVFDDITGTWSMGTIIGDDDLLTLGGE
jgi:hypothetical protein